jgi:hypothetical protein
MFTFMININTDYKSGPGKHLVAVISLNMNVCILIPFWAWRVGVWDLWLFKMPSYIKEIIKTKCVAFCMAFILSVKNKKELWQIEAHFNAPLFYLTSTNLCRRFAKVSSNTNASQLNRGSESGFI